MLKMNLSRYRKLPFNFKILTSNCNISTSSENRKLQIAPLKLTYNFLSESFQTKYSTPKETLHPFFMDPCKTASQPNEDNPF